MNIFEIAKECGFENDAGYNSLLISVEQLEAFAAAIYAKAIEEYKASLVPVMWWDGESDYPEDIMLPSIRQSHIDTNSTMYLDYPIALYAIPLGDITQL
jgi:hypothetical protein